MRLATLTSIIDCLTETAQVCAFGNELAPQAVGVFVGADLLGGMRITEPDVDLEAARKFGMAGGA